MTEKPPPLIQFNLPKVDGLAGIKMGPGVMGRASSVCVPLGVAGCAVSFGLIFVQWWAALIALAMTFGAVMLIMSKAFKHMDKNPDQALLEGAQLLKKHQLDQTARDSKIIEVTATPVANTSPPQRITAQDEGNE